MACALAAQPCGCDDVAGGGLSTDLHSVSSPASNVLGTSAFLRRRADGAALRRSPGLDSRNSISQLLHHGGNSCYLVADGRPIS
jgi:hypothetical protein